MTCCAVVAARPPHSSGQRIAAQRPSLSLFCHALRLSITPITPRDGVGVFVVGPLLDERRHLLVEERFELLFEGDVFGRPGEVHTKPDITVRSPVASSSSWTSRSRPSRRRCATRCARSSRPRRRWSTCGAWPSTTTRASRPRCGARSSTSAGPACSCPSRRAASVSALVDAVVVQEEMGRALFPGPFFSSAILATLAARALGLDDQLAALAAGTRTRHGRARRSRLRRPDRARARARRRPRHPLQARRREADGARRLHRRLGARARAHPRGAPDVPRRRPRTRSRSRASTSPASSRATSFDETRATLVGPPGDHADIWRRVIDDAGVLIGRRADRRERSREPARARLRAGARGVRQAALEVPGDAAQGRRHAARDRARARRRALRGVGVRRRSRRPRDRGRARPRRTPRTRPTT